MILFSTFVNLLHISNFYVGEEQFIEIDLNESLNLKRALLFIVGSVLVFTNTSCNFDNENIVLL